MVNHRTTGRKKEQANERAEEEVVDHRTTGRKNERAIEQTEEQVVKHRTTGRKKEQANQRAEEEVGHTPHKNVQALQASMLVGGYTIEHGTSNFESRKAIGCTRFSIIEIKNVRANEGASERTSEGMSERTKDRADEGPNGRRTELMYERTSERASTSIPFFFRA